MTYASYDAAARRVSVLTQQGIWPAIVHRQDGTFGLSYDPDDAPKDTADA